MPTNTVYPANALTGGAVGALDGYSGALLVDGDIALVVVSGVTYIYQLDADSGLAESPPLIIAPDVSAGAMRWVLTGQSVSEVVLNRKVSSSGPEGTIFYCSDDNSVWVGTE